MSGRGSAQTTVVVAGNGMVGHRFVHELTERTGNKVRVVVFGDETRPAYDRVHLTRMLEGARIDDLALANRAWYQRRGVELCLGDPIVSVDSRRRTVRARSGSRTPYDYLVLATGAAPRVPAICERRLPGVFVYRSAADLRAIRQRARRSTCAAVLGGGLLGLEAAAALASLGLDTTVIEAGTHLLARQLDAPSAALVAHELQRRGITTLVDSCVQSIRQKDDRLVVAIDGAAAHEVDLVVLATGVRPRDDLARGAGLAVDDVRGGIAVDDHLTTSSPRILAIGDCARHAGISYGLVGPGYQMARAAAAHLTGDRDAFTGGDASVRLDVAGIDVVAVGDFTARGRTLVHQTPSTRRTLVLRDGDTVVGARSVGGWPNLAAVEQAIGESRSLSRIEIERFCRTGHPWPEPSREQLTVRSSDELLACRCARVSFGMLRAELARGSCSIVELGRATGAGTVCGSCQPVLAELCGVPRPATRSSARWLLAGCSLAALAICALLFFAAPWPLSEVEASGLRRLSHFWQSGSGKVISGAVVVGLSLVGLVVTARKRIRRLRRGSMAWFRALHGVAACLAIAALMVHTRMQMGENLNRTLMNAFVGTVASGAALGLVCAVDNAGRRLAAASRKARPYLAIGHWLFLAALPVLLVFHVVAVLYF